MFSNWFCGKNGLTVVNVGKHQITGIDSIIPICYNKDNQLST